MVETPRKGGRIRAAFLILTMCLAWMCGGCAHMAGDITEEVVLTGTDVGLETLSTHKHRDQLGSMVELVSRNIALGLVGGLREGLVNGVDGDAGLDLSGFMDRTFGQVGAGLELHVSPVLSAMLGDSVDALLDRVLARSGELNAFVSQLGESMVGAAMSRLAWSIDHELSPSLARAIERDLGPALARAIDSQIAPALAVAIDTHIGPALARTLERDLGPAMRVVIQRDLVAALDDEQVLASLQRTAYSLGRGSSEGFSDGFSTPEMSNTDEIDIHEIGENIDAFMISIMALMGAGVILIATLTVAMWMRIYGGIKKGIEEHKAKEAAEARGEEFVPKEEECCDEDDVLPHTEDAFIHKRPYMSRRDELYELLLLTMAARNGDGATAPEIQRALDERLEELIAARRARRGGGGARHSGRFEVDPDKPRRLS